MTNSKLVFTGKDNLIDKLAPATALRIKYRMAKDRKVSIDEITEIFPEDLIRYSNPRNNALASQEYRLSRTVKVAKKTIETVVVCEQTGVNIGIDIPRIPGFFLVYTSPLAEYSNCRLLASRGYEYLHNLDTQVLAGIAMVLAENYNLFVFPASMNGIQKNAILRSCGKTELINCILCIERNIHSHNFESIPQISFNPSEDIKQGEMETRMCNWLKLVVQALRPIASLISSNSIEIEDIPVKRLTGGYVKIRDLNKLNRAKESAAKAEKRELIKKLEVATKATRDLFKDSILSIQMRNFLLKTFDADTFPTVDATFKAKLSLKLATMGIEDTGILSIQDVLSLKTEVVELEEFEEIRTFAPEAMSVPQSSPESIPQNLSAIPTAEVSEDVEFISIGINTIGEAVKVPANFWKAMGFSQRLLYKKKAGIIS